MGKPRILLLPEFTELEWKIKPQLEQWAEVASFDAPGVGEESVSQVELDRIASEGGYRHETTARRALEEAEGRSWDRFVVVSDSGANPAACLLARRRPDARAAVEAFPGSARVADKPSVSADFADLVRDFCQAARRS
jgi:hypothetical protein